MKISATVITSNEEDNIEEALASLSWADEIIVVDSGSTDRTVELARRFTDRVLVREWPGYAAQKNLAADQASYDWVFNLDADERVSKQLRTELENLQKGSEPEAPAFEMPRRTFYLGRWIRHSGWYPDYKLRLYNRTRGRWRGDFVHESVQVDGKVEKLTGEIEHFTVRNASEHHLRLDSYTTLAADEMRTQGKSTSLPLLLTAPIAAFIKSYFLKLGFLDAVPGLVIARFAAHYAFMKHIKLWEKNRESRADQK